VSQEYETPAPAGSAPTELSIEEALELAMTLQRKGDRVTPAVLYQRVLAVDHGNATALHFLGLMAFEAGQLDPACALVAQALKHAPGYVDAHINLGNLHQVAGRLGEAESCFRRALALQPDHVAGLNNLAAVLADMGRVDEAEQHCRAAVAQVPDAPAFQTNLGHILRRAGRQEEALRHFCEAALLDPDTRLHRGAMVSVLVALGRLDEAAQMCRDWLARDPDDVFARHHLAACAHEDVPLRADDAYVRTTFDQFAGSFEAKLALLDYRAPELIGRLVGRLYAEGQRGLQVLDAGCGTGLCAPWLRPLAAHLSGVDLSGRMVDLARARKVYDALEVAELGLSLGQRRDTADLIVAADVLCYFGALGDVFQASAQALRAGGRLVFTVEWHEDRAGDGFILHPHGRYSHAEGYVRRTLAAAGLTVEVCEHHVLRNESARPVQGLLVAAVALSGGHAIPQ